MLERNECDLPRERDGEGTRLVHHRRRSVLPVLLAALGVAGLVMACGRHAPGISITVDTTQHSYAIPTDFAGLSFEAATLRFDENGVSGYFFSPTNTALITLFENMGIGNLRIGGGTVDQDPPAGTQAHGYEGVNAFFGFAAATGVRVIYSLRLLETLKDYYPNLESTDATIAGYIWDHYRSSVQAFAIGNEPDFYRGDPNISGFPSYLAEWQSFADAIEAAAPGAKFAGPDTGSYTDSKNYDGEPWTVDFANSEKGKGLIAVVTQHDYVGGSAGTTTATQAIFDMLSPQWVNGTALGTGPEGPAVYSPYTYLYQHNLAPVLADGFPYRMTEANDYLGGIQGASNSFASALWALDYMHWWAEHGAAGVNFHNKQWILTDTIIPGGMAPCIICAAYQIRPKGYGIKAFNIGGHGYVEPLSLANPQGLNVTAYAVGDSADLYVTIINKTEGATAASAAVTITPDGMPDARVAEMTLTDGKPGDPALLDATLGGATITDTGRWTGIWTPLPPETHGRVVLTVPASTAVIVRIQKAGADAGPIRMNENGTLALVGVGAGGAVEVDTQKGIAAQDSAPKGWSGFTPLPTGVTATGGAAEVTNANDTLEVFVPGALGVDALAETQPNGPWGGWQSLGGQGVHDLEARTNPDGSVSLFGIGTKGGLWVDSESAPGIGWSGWTELGDRTVEPGYAVGQESDGLLEVFGRSDGAVWSIAETKPGSWGTWQSLGGSVGPQLAVTSDLDGAVDVFGTAPNGDLEVDRQEKGHWTGWRRIGGPSLRPGLAVGQEANGDLVVFGVSSKGYVAAVTEREPGGGFGKWSDLGGSGLTAPLTVGSTASGGIQLFGTKASGVVWSDGQSASGRWSGWTSFGGSGIALH